MTVRTWFTISALVLVALAGAFAFRLSAPIPAPSVRVRTGDVRLPGVLVKSCWPQRSGGLRCHEPHASPPRAEEIRGSGAFRVVVTYPAQPQEGSIVVRSGGRTVLRKGWVGTIRYSLGRGAYELSAEARYPAGAFVRYVFRFNVTRSGS